MRLSNGRIDFIHEKTLTRQIGIIKRKKPMRRIAASAARFLVSVFQVAILGNFQNNYGQLFTTSASLSRILGGTG